MKKILYPESRSNFGGARSKLFWWLYIIFILSVGYGRMIERLVKSSGGFWSQFGPAIGATILAIGLIYWLQSKRILNQWAWRGVLICLVLIQLSAIAFAVYLLATSVIGPAAMLTLAALSLVPANIALFQYACRSPDLWRTT